MVVISQKHLEEDRRRVDGDYLPSHVPYRHRPLSLHRAVLVCQGLFSILKLELERMDLFARLLELTVQGNAVSHCLPKQI